MSNVIILKESKDSEISLLRGVMTENWFDTKFIQIREGLSLGWSDFLNVRNVKFLNPCTDVELRIMKLIKSTSMATIRVDWSIDPFSIPEDHSYYKYMSPSNDQIIKECFYLADTLICSNTEIEKRLSIFVKGESFTLESRIQNYPGDIFTYAPMSDKKVVLWRGNESFLKNLTSYIPQINKVGDEFPDWEFVFIADIDTRYVKLPNHIPKKAIVPYLATLREINPAIMICPMIMDEYARTRNSDMYWESKIAGAVCLAPDIPSWQDKPAMLYSNHNGFEESLRLLMTHSELREKLYHAI